MKISTLVILFVSGCLLTTSPFAVQAATINYVGLLTDSPEAVNWLTPSTAKTYDIDGDNKYGSYCAVHWRVLGTFTATSIGYIGSGGQYKQPEYPKINNLADATLGAVGPGALVNNNPTNDNGSIALNNHTFQINEDLTGKVLRVGVMEDMLGPAEYPRDTHKGVRLVQIVGGSDWSVVVPLPNANGQPEMVFFDIVDAQVGDQFRAEEVRDVGGTDQITTYVGPVSWDINNTSAVSTAPKITVASGDDSCRAGSDYVLGVLAGGAPSPTYQWYKGASAITGATRPMLWLNNVSLSDSAAYSVAATTPAGSVTSAPMALTIVSTNVPSRLSGYRTAVMAEPSLISYYTFDNGGTDSKGTHNGNIAGTPAVGYKLGQGVGRGIDKALVLGADGLINLGDVPDFDFTSGYGTVELWVRADWTNNIYNPCVLGDRDTSGTTYSIHMGGNKDSAGVYNGSSYLTVSVPPAGTSWHQLAVIFNNGSWILVWDGQVRGTNVQTLGSAAVPTLIGSSSSLGRENWMGALDEVAFYADALAPDRILAHYNAYLASDPPVILAQPEGNVLPAGTPFQMSVQASGNLLSYQWYKNGGAVIGETSNMLSFASLTLADAGTYVCVVTNQAGAITSSPALLQISSAITAAVTAYEAAVQSESSLISFYKFNDLTANDSKGSNNGTLVGTTTFRAGFGGGPDQALSVSGSGWVNLGVVPDLDFSDFTGTVELWLRADWASLGDNACLFADRDTASGLVNYSIHLGSAKDRIYFWNGASAPTVMLPAPAGTNWHHMAVSFDNGNWTVIWDGQNLGANILFNTGNSTTTQIGSSAATGAEQWIGRLDEVAFYADALTDTQIQAHYAAYYSLIPPAITTQPQGGSYLLGNGFSLTVGAVGANPHYQWFKNNAPVGGDAADLSFAAAALSDSGNYFVVVSNTIGSVTSAVASVSVVSPHVPEYRATVLAEPGLISYFPFDDQTANDLVSTNHGAIQGTGIFTNGLGGGTNLAFLMDGFSDWIVFADAPAFDFRNSEGSGTIEAWVRADWTSDPGYDPYIVADSDGTANNYIVQMNRNKNAVASWAIPPAGVNWHHMAVVFYFGNRSLYWDGVAAGATLWQPLYAQTPVVPFQVGSWASYGQEMWIGAIDDLAIYNVGLSAEAIQRHYQTMFQGATAPIPLQIRQAGGIVTLSWAANAVGWTLESATSLPAASWDPVPGVVNNSVTVPATGTARFFRLRSQ